MPGPGDIDISLIPQEYGKEQRVQKRLGSATARIISRISIVVLMLALAAWFGLYIYQSSYLETDLMEKKSEMAVIEKTLEAKGGLAEVRDQDRTMLSSIDAIKNHLYASNVFHFIELHTHKDVRYRNFSYKSVPQQNTARIAMESSAPDVKTIAKQMIAFTKEREEIAGLSRGAQGAQQAGTKRDTAATKLNMNGFTYANGAYMFNVAFDISSEYIKTNFFATIEE